MATPGAGDPISERLRTNKQQISDKFETAVRATLPQLARFDSHTLVDHLPEMLEGLARWIDGDREGARAGLDSLADGHALQRLGYGVDLEVLTSEYSILRSVLIRHCLSREIERAPRESLARLDEALDDAILGAVRRYMKSRDHVRDRFIGILAHDLRNPLGTITIAAGRLIATEDPESRINKMAGMILRSTERMARMISDVIELAREHLGDGIPIKLVAADLGDIAREAFDELAAGSPGRDMTIECSGDLTGYWDRDRVVQAMSNVIANALQHGDDPIRVEIRESRDRQHVTSIVSNSGTAPTPAQLATMFDPFRGTRKPGTGLGLGLYIVRAIARAHGATVHVGVGNDGQGFRFAVDWPRTPLEETPRRGTSPPGTPGPPDPR